jgi:hypothetical protein
MKDEWKKVLREMRHEGYAVIVWTPEKLGDVDPEGLEEASISFGIDYLIDYEDAPKKGEAE